MSQGAIYIITQNEHFIGLVLNSAASLKRAMPALPITLFSEFAVESPLFEKIIRIEKSSDGLYDKTRWMGESPYAQTIFLDADTYIVEPFHELFSMLEQFDIAATHEEYVNTDWFNRYPRLDIPTSYPEFNTGVLLFKQSEKMKRFLDEWRRLHEEYVLDTNHRRVNDQPFFRVAMYYGNLRMATLTREYNCKFRGQGYLNGAVKILHGHHKFRLEPKYVSRVLRVLNASVKPRVYIAGKVYEYRITGRLEGKRTAHFIGAFPEPPESLTLLRLRVLRSRIQHEGLQNFFRRVLKR